MLNKAINAALADPKIKARSPTSAASAMGGTPADFGKIVASETEKWRKVVEFSGAQRRSRPGLDRHGRACPGHPVFA